MAVSSLNVLAVVGSLNLDSVTRVAVQRAAVLLRSAGCTVDVLDLLHEQLPLYSPDSASASAQYAALQQRVERADAYVLGTPDYHGCISSALKNFLDHFWKEFTGKLFAAVVASHEKGLTVIDQLRTVARQCYAWSLPYGVSLVDQQDVRDGQIVSDALENRLQMMARDLRVYGQLLAQQRRADLHGSEPGFLAKMRVKG